MKGKMRWKEEGREVWEISKEVTNAIALKFSIAYFSHDLGIYLIWLPINSYLETVLLHNIAHVDSVVCTLIGLPIHYVP